MTPLNLLEPIRKDLAYSVRCWRRQPGFVAVAILTLALGIGANTAIFSVVHAVLLRPLPYQHPERLVAVWNRWDGRPTAPLSEPEYLDYSEQSQSMTLAGSSTGAVNVGATGGDPERVTSASVTVNALDVLGVGPTLGRGFRTEDGEIGGPRVAILSDRFWRRRFAAERGAVGRMVSIDGLPAEIVGVMPRGVALPIELGAAVPVDVIVPLVLDRAAPRNRRGGHYLQAFARLHDGEDAAAASAEMDRIIAQLIRTHPDEHDQGHFGVVVRSLPEDRVGDSRPVLAVLVSAVGLVLVLTCANVANLLLARGEARRRELAVRTALGADRFRIIRQLLTESCVLSLAGATAGLAVARLCLQVVVRNGTGALPRLEDAQLSLPVLLFTATLAIATAVLFGLVPALQVSRAGSREILNENGRSHSGRTRLRHALVVGQVVAASVILVVAGLLIKSFVRLTHVPSGIDSEHVLTLRVTLPASRYPERSNITGFFGQLLSRVRALPGVKTAGASSGLPLAVQSGDWNFDIEGRPRIGTRSPGAADWHVVTPGYFEALGIPLRRGRLPAESDVSAAPPVVFINETTARTLFKDEDPIGRRIRLGRSTGAEQPWRTIAGVVGDVRHRGLAMPPMPEMFIPYEQFLHFSAGAQARAMSLVIKADRDPAPMVSVVRGTLAAVDPEVPAAQVRDMTQVLAASVADRRLNVLMIGAFGVLALVLATIGLYGVMAYSVTERTREMGVRIAIGATPASVLVLIVGQGLRLVGIGVAVGLVFALIMSGSLATLLYDVGPRDVSIFAIAFALLLITGAIASYLPARRATRVDPVVALRTE
jgi:putative ABC transport system permease protein